MNNDSERNVLREFFESVSAVKPLDSTICDSKTVRDTNNKLKTALRGMASKCTCSKRSYSICEVCQGSDRDLVFLRTFFRQIRNAKKHNMTATEIHDFVENTVRELK